MTDREPLIQKYENGTQRLRAALEKVPPEAMHWNPAPGKWSVHEVICHCADSEMTAGTRIRYLLVEKDPVVVGYDQDLWCERLDYRHHPIEPALQLVDAVRANTTAMIRRLPSDAWDRGGSHTERGTYSAHDWLETYAEHLEIHARQIDRILVAWNARPERAE